MLTSKSPLPIIFIGSWLDHIITLELNTLGDLESRALPGTLLDYLTVYKDDLSDDTGSPREEPATHPGL